MKKKLNIFSLCCTGNIDKKLIENKYKKLQKCCNKEGRLTFEPEVDQTSWLMAEKS